MKRNIFEQVVTLVNGGSVADMETLRAEINAEWARMNAKRNATANSYEQAKPIILNAIADHPMTVKEIYEACADELPADFTPHKIQYGLIHYWADEVVKHSNGKNPFTYSAK